jgi:hypothetical protein
MILKLGVGNLLIMTVLPVLLCLFRVLVELACITSSPFDRWNIWRINILLSQPLPRDLGEPLMVFDIFRPSMEIAQALGQIGSNETLKQILGVWMDVRRVLDPSGYSHRFSLETLHPRKE